MKLPKRLDLKLDLEIDLWKIRPGVYIDLRPFPYGTAEEALLQADRETTPVLMPFRVWVLPKWENGSMISGHYEYFEMLMPREGLVLVSPELVPVIPTP